MESERVSSPPEFAIPLRVDADDRVSQEKFLEEARKRVRILDQQAYIDWQWEQVRAGNLRNVMPFGSARFFIQRGKSPNEIVAFGAAVNQRSLTQTQSGEDYSDLAPYLVEHEAYEAWIEAVEGPGADLVSRHDRARVEEFVLAMRNGQAERLLKWHMEANVQDDGKLPGVIKKARDQLK